MRYVGRELSQQINRILENIQKLEGFGLVTKEDNYESFVHAVALEVANRATIRENQRKEISRYVALFLACCVLFSLFPCFSVSTLR